MNKHMLTLIVMFAAATLSGCETVKGTVTGGATGLGKDIQNTSNNVAKAADKTFNPSEGPNRGWVYRTDDWMRKNMW